MGYKVGYKVVEARKGYVNEKYFSAVVGKKWAQTPELGLAKSVEYKVNEWVSPNSGYGPLAVFREDVDARYWFNSMDFSECMSTFKGEFKKFYIFKCRYRPSKQENLFIKFLNLVKKGWELPSGTEKACSVMLIERIRA